MNNTYNSATLSYPSDFLGPKSPPSSEPAPASPTFDINNLLSMLGGNSSPLASLLPALMGGSKDTSSILSMLGGNNQLGELLGGLTKGNGANILSSIFGNKKKQADAPPAKLTTNFVKANEYKF